MSMRDERLRSQRIENIKSVRPYNPVQEVARTGHVLVTGTRFGAFEGLERLGAGGMGEEEGATFLVMKYVTGETLANRLERALLRIEEVLRYGVQIAEALDAAHRSSVVHRDLKPSNIMLSQSGVKLLDFGFAKLRDIDAERIGDATTMSLGLSDDGLILGSLPYMAPVQLEGSPWMRVLTSSRWARCSTRWRPVNRRFEGAARQA
jgi:serine/threonine protein kinase